MEIGWLSINSDNIADLDLGYCVLDMLSWITTEKKLNQECSTWNIPLKN